MCARYFEFVGIGEFSEGSVKDTYKEKIAKGINKKGGIKEYDKILLKNKFLQNICVLKLQSYSLGRITSIY